MKTKGRRPFLDQKYYFQLISAIPSDLKRRAAQTFIPAADLFLISLSVPLNKTSFDLAVARCKNYYQLFNSYSCTVPSGIKKWQQRFPEIFADWCNKFQDIYRFTRDNKLRQFCFRFLHRTVVTKRELKLFHLADNDKCIYCSNADSIEHTFIDCRESVKLYPQIISWFNHCQDTAITLSNEKVAFHDCGRQKEPAILISTLLLQTHAPQLYSLALTRFCWNLESSTTNAWNAKNAIFSRASRVTFGPWITWRSRIAAAPTNPNRACQLGFDLSVHVVALYAFRLNREWQLFVLNFNRGASELFAHSPFRSCRHVLCPRCILGPFGGSAFARNLLKFSDKEANQSVVY